MMTHCEKSRIMGKNCFFLREKMVPTIGKSTKSKLRSKISIFFPNFFPHSTLLYSFHRLAFFCHWGKNGDFSAFYGEEMGKFFECQ